MAAMQELQSTYSDLLSTQDQLAATQQENAALKERCNEFVKANLDHMLGWRSLKTKADALEGEPNISSGSTLRLACCVLVYLWCGKCCTQVIELPCCAVYQN